MEFLFGLALVGLFFFAVYKMVNRARSVDRNDGPSRKSDTEREE
jgi:hypothetical protein